MPTLRPITTETEIDYEHSTILAINQTHLVVWRLAYKAKEKGSPQSGWNFQTKEGTNVVAFYSTPKEAIASVMRLWPRDVTICMVEP